MACAPFVDLADVVEGGRGLAGGCERGSRLELQRAPQPRSDAAGKLFEPRRGDGADAVDHFGDPPGILVLAQRPADDQRQCHRAELGNVGAAIEQCRRVRRQGDAEVLPVALRRETQLLERGAEHVLGDDDARVAGDEDALRRQRAVAGAPLLVQRGDGGGDLPDDAERGIDLDGNQALVGDGQHLRQADALDVVRGQRQAQRRPGHVHDAAGARERVVVEAREPGQALAQRGFERRVRRELAVEKQDAERLVPRADDAPALAETVLEDDRWKGRSR